jgi:HK97 family phage major capsid protein
MAQTAKDFLKSEMNRKLEEAKAITAKVEAEGRSVTSEEKDQVEKLVAEAQTFKSRIEKMDETEQLRESIDKMTGVFNEPAEQAPQGAKSLGDAFVKSDAYKALKNGGMKAQRWTSGVVDLGFDALGGKATMTEAASVIVQPDVQPGVQLINQRRLVVADLMASGSTTSNSVRYLVETTATNAAAAVAEEGAKPESTLVLDEVDEPVRKIATVLPVSDEMLEDEAQIRSYIDARLRLFIQLTEETQLLVGDGTAPNISGIMDRSGLQTGTKAALQTASGAATPNVADAIYQAITNIRVNALTEPDGVVVHPTNWATIRLLKDSALQYFGGGPFTGAYGNSGGLAPNNIWGLPAVVTPAMTLHTLIVGAFRSQSQIFRKGGITVEASNSHSDYFIKNLTAIRAEERLALAVYRPAAFHAITALNV